MAACSEGATSSESGSDSEEYQRLKSVAVDVAYIGRSLPAKQKELPGTSAAHVQKPSLRSLPGHEDKPQTDATPEFRKHVARKLSEALDSQIEVGEAWTNVGRGSPSEPQDDFRLFSSSKAGAPAEVTTAPCSRRRPRRASSSSDSDSEVDRLAAAAVTGEMILANSSIPGQAGQGSGGQRSAGFQATSTSPDELSSCVADAKDIATGVHKRKKKKKRKLPDYENDSSKESQINKGEKIPSKPSNGKQHSCSKKKKKDKNKKEIRL